ncbi:Thiamine transporter [Colletotrichum chlorophyti]|uniref:Thiamine transporter n=1 Tax=Colletotrichum chlorophyti TaxID=708187 RepID=A0A1Q8RTA9_9PEZI|nr:Thiamine transporter [Colletotrichum chlorophyti]
MGRSILERIKVRDDTEHGYETTRWINPDIAPLPPNRRTWGVWAFLGFGSISNLCISAWTGAASLLSLGLTIPQTIGLMILARALICLLVIGNGWMGAEWHIGFTVSQRIILGMNGAYIGQVIRIMLSIVWYGSQAWLGGLCVSAMLSSWSYKFLTMENTLPESAHMVTRDLVGFVIFHLVSVPFLLIRVEKAKVPVIIANLIVLVTMMGITIWACTTGGTGPLFESGAKQPSTLTKEWAWVYGIIASVGNISAGILNQSDFTRFARRQGVQVPGIVFSLFIPGMIVPIFAILTASASMSIWNLEEPMWNPLTVITQWMVDDYNAKTRAGAFFCSLGFVLGQIAENILGNGYAAGMDLAGLMPTWITIRRGALLAAALSWAVQPWEFYNTASVFVSVAASFSVFMGPLTGIMMTDYFVIRRQKIEMSQLYTGSKEGAYWYAYGFNWRAFVAWVVCFVPAMPGMIAAVNPNVEINDGLYKYYLGNYIFGFLEAGTLYAVLTFTFKPKRLGLQDDFDIYGTFEDDVAIKKGIAPFERPKGVDNPIEGTPVQIDVGGPKKASKTMGNTISYEEVPVELSLGDKGKIRGLQFDDKSRRYAGVPYALPPTGEHKWRKPRPLPSIYSYRDSSGGAYDATTFNAVCPQRAFQTVKPDGGGNRYSEDCLYVNIWTPVAKEGDKNPKWPVKLWIHGGWFQMGDPSQKPGMDATELISTGKLNAIVVAIGYRLNVFGFLAGHDLLHESNGEAGGNFGLWDQRLAAEWVRDNIAHFGGDPNNITLAGRSAGAYSAEVQML